MSFYPHSPENDTGLEDVSKSYGNFRNQPKSDVQVTVGRRQYTLTEAQEAFAQRVVREGREPEMPHRAGRRQIRQRVLDILRNGAPVVAKAKPRSEYVWIVRRIRPGAVLGVRRTKTEGKELAQASSKTTIEWTNTKDGSFSPNFDVVKVLVPKTPR